MNGSALATLLVAIVAMAPGVLLCRDLRYDPGRLAAVGAASLAISAMVTALAGVSVQMVAGESLPAWSLAPVSLLLAAGSVILTRGRPWQRPQIEWAGIGVAAIFVLFGAVVYSSAVTELPDGSLRIHAWYNADWFKHIGHTYGIADYGVPARDIFGAARPLRYYWLSYLLPGAGTALGGDAWGALFAANAIYSALLALTLFGVVRLTGASSWICAVVTLLAAIISATPLTGIQLLSPGGYDALMFGREAPLEPALLSLLLYIPQHAFALALLSGWAVLALANTPSRLGHMVALAALATVMTISTLFGATLLAVYGFVELYRRKLNAVPELLIMAMASVLLVFMLGIVPVDAPIASSVPQTSRTFGIGDEAGALERGTTSVLLLMRNAGLPVFVSIYLLLRWKPEDGASRNARILAATLLLTAALAAAGAELAIGKLVAHEIRLRVLNLIGVATALAGGWALGRAWTLGSRRKAMAITALALLTAAAAPTAIVRTVWHANARDSFITIVPADDRAVLATLRSQSHPRDVVWQYPEEPFLSEVSGDDSWSVVFGGRANIAATRATDRPASDPYIHLGRRYFSGEDVPLPASIDWIYLSRKLHAASYDRLVDRLSHDQAWSKAACLPNACIFRRTGSGR